MQRAFEQEAERVPHERFSLELSDDLSFEESAAPVTERRSEELLLSALGEEVLDLYFTPLLVHKVTQSPESPLLEVLVSSELVHASNLYVVLQTFEDLPLERLLV